MKRWPVALALVAVALVLLAAFAPRPPAAYEPPVPAEERAKNAAILAALAAAGIERAWVDARPERVLVALDAPAGVAVEDALRYALGAAAVVAPDAVELEARSTTGLAWRVEGAALRAYLGGSLSKEGLEAVVEKGTG